ncbi:helix-turn-helix domain-containing protein [Hyalangium gracile]|uniref:helix-turn-helix domain-containing protein n=1 Tax=Hyalangium gracile TaxID=394092 RepID=UPI001CC903C5|nr:helix-turn-helix domain-containing protein [Hyalangium gracile]
MKGQVEEQDDILRAIYEELRGLRESVNEIHMKISHAAPAQVARARAVSVEDVQTILGCGRSRIFELLRSGALRRGPKVGRAAMICAKSLEALLERVDREPVTPRLKRRPTRRDTGCGRSESEAILRLIRSA